MDIKLNTLTRKIVQRFAKNILKKLHSFEDFPQMAVFSNDGLGQSVIIEGWAEKYFLEQLTNKILPSISQKEIALDLGANIGNHSLWFAEYFTAVHSFEPNERAYLLLKANSMLVSNIHVHNVGCSDETVANQLAKYSKTNIGGARLDSSPPNHHFPKNEDLVETTYFNLIKLDDYLPQETHDKVGLIKCDVEGFEEKALKGAEKIISASKPVIAFEVNDFESVLNYLVSQGYSNFYGIAKFRGIYTFSVLPNILQFIPVTKDNLSQVYRDMVIATNFKIDL